MLYIGPAGIPASSSAYEEGLEKISALGLNALEIEFVFGVRMGYEEASRIGRLAAKRGVRLSAHAPYYINLNSKEAAIVERSRGRIVDTMRMAGALGAKTVVVHAGYYSGMGSAEATRVMVERVSECRRAADAEGCESVILGLETMGRRASWGTLPEIKEVSRRVERVYPVLDFGHIHSRCQGCLRTAEAFLGLLDDIEELGAPFLHCHFSGVEFGRAGERRHLEVRSASPDFALLAPLLLARPTDITLICESPLLEQDALLMKEMVGKATEAVGSRQ
jgi:deoxyribonuclease-4